MITQTDQAATAIYKATIIYSGAGAFGTQTIINTTKSTISIAKFATGKYSITPIDGLPIFRENGLTKIFPEISDWSSIPLSKTTWSDYHYRFIYLSPIAIHIYCNKTSDLTFADFDAISTAIQVPIHIEIYNYKLD